MTRRFVNIYGVLGALGLAAVAVQAGVSFTGPDRAPAARPAAAHPAAAHPAAAHPAAAHPATAHPATAHPAATPPDAARPAGTGSADTGSADTGSAGTGSAGAVAGAPPAALAPPAGHVVHAVLKARGVQVYRCRAGTWEPLEPAASLTGVTVRPVRKVTALHFRGPSWQSAQDGSLIEGDPASVVRAPSGHRAGIPQLRVTAKAARGPGVFGKVTYVQRLDTVGGAAPGTTCSGSRTTAVPYRAVYRFFIAGS